MENVLTFIGAVLLIVAIFSSIVKYAESAGNFHRTGYLDINFTVQVIISIVGAGLIIFSNGF